MKNILYISCILISFATISYAQVVNVCFGEGDGVFVPDVTNCSNYYTCFQDVGYLQTCPDSFLFSSDKQACDYASDVNCLTCPAATTAALSFIAVPGVCNKYIICAGGMPFMQSCQGGLEYNNSTDQCDFATNVNCAKKPANCPASTTNVLTFIAGGGECTTYTICYKGTGFSQTCATGTLFNPSQNACVPAASYTCTTSATATSARNVFLSGFVKPSSYEMKYRQSALCPTTGKKSIRDAHSCTRYVFCVNGKSALLSCAEGLHFDAKTETCRLPADANCKV